MHQGIKIVVGVAVLVGVASCSVRTGEPDAGPADPTTTTTTTTVTTSTTGPVDTPADVSVGDCLEVTDPSPADYEVATTGCADHDAVFEVATIEDGPNGRCPTDDYDTYSQTGQDEFTLCLMLNGRQGECFDGLLVGAGPSGPVRATCRTAGAMVTKVLPNRADIKACPPGTAGSMAYPQPAPGRTVCLSVPNPPGVHPPPTS